MLYQINLMQIQFAVTIIIRAVNRNELIHQGNNAIGIDFVLTIVDDYTVHFRANGSIRPKYF